MKRSLTEVESIVRERICGICSDRAIDGTCGLSEPAHCALFRLFPEVARAIAETSSDSVVDYIAAIRRNVCSICEQEATENACVEREQVRCALDAYLLLVVDAIEEATGKTFNRGEFPAIVARPEFPQISKAS